MKSKAMQKLDKAMEKCERAHDKIVNPLCMTGNCHVCKKMDEIQAKIKLLKKEKK